MQDEVPENGKFIAKSVQTFRYASQRELRIEEFSIPFGEGLNPKAPSPLTKA